MTQQAIVLISIAAVIGLVIGFLISTIKANAKRKTIDEQNAVLTNELAAQQDRASKLSDQLQSANESVQRLQVTEAEKETKLSSLTAEHEKLAATKTEQDQRISELNGELTQTKETLSATRAQFEAEVQKAASQHTTIEHLNAELKVTRTEVTQVKDKHAALDKNAKGLEVSANEAEKNLAEVKQRLDELQVKRDQLQEKYTSLSSEYVELKTSLDERDISHKEKLAQLEENKQALTKEFENLANKIFEEKGKTFTDTSKSSIDVMLKPFREQIDGFQKRINEVHDASTQGNASLNAEIKKVLDIGLKMSAEATNLTSALKGDSQKRGAWGEAQLERTLEMSGLVQDTHFEKQSAFKDEDGKRRQTDYIIKLPGEKHIIIDSKVSLLAYDRSISAKTDEEYNLAVAEHIKAVKSHIDDLASKDYTNLVGVRSPNFVLMFMPIEPAYIEALKNTKDLFNYGYEKSIVLVSHTTLIPILRTVANLWVMEQSNKEAREISDRAGLIYNNVCTLAEKLNKLGNTLNSASNHYNDTVKSLVGKQGLHGKVERFTQLSSKVTKTMPALEAKHMDFETEKLTLVAEPILGEAELTEDLLAEVADESEELSVEQPVKGQLNHD